MTRDTTCPVGARLSAHAARAARLPFARTAHGALATAVDIIEMLGWQPSQILAPASDMARAEECVLLARDGKTPEILLVGEPFGTTGMRGEIEEAARSVAVPFLVATDTRSWTFMDMDSHRVLTLRDMVWSSEASRGLDALSPGTRGPDAFRDLLSYADVLADQEAAAAALLRDYRSMLAPYLVSMAARRGRVLDPARVESLVGAALLSTDLLLPGENLPPQPDPDMPREGWAMMADAVADRTEAPAPANTPAAETQTSHPGEGRVFGPPRNAHNGRDFMFEALSRHVGVLRKGSQIVTEPLGTAHPETTQRIAEAHADICARGAAIEAVDSWGDPCLELTQDVENLAPGRACYAIYGTSRNSGTSLFCREDGLRWKDHYPARNDLRRAA